MAHTALISELERAASASARFYVCNLHVHSPGSSDYGQPSGLDGSPGTYAPEEKALGHAEWLSRVKDTGLQVVAVTDHNAHGWGCAAAGVAPAGLVVLPGCEISVYHKTVLSDVVVHLLALFDPGTDPEHIERVFSWMRCSEPESRRDANFVLEADLNDVVKAIHDLDGICIAAHTASNNGARTASLLLSYDVLRDEARLRYLKAQPKRSEAEEREAKELRDSLAVAISKAQERYLEFLVENRVDAVQIAKPQDEKHYGLLHVAPFGADGPISCILATDSHRLCDVCLPKYMTHIKMDRPSVAGLRKAFRDPGTRIRFRTQPPLPYPRLRGLAFMGADTFFGRGAEIDKVFIGFSDNLTCAIGGRGSGKSCIVEAIRYAQGSAPAHAVGKRAKDDYDRYLAHILGSGTVAAVVEMSSAERLVVKRTHGSGGAPIVAQPDGVQRHVDAASVLRVDVYGQSELEQVAGDKSAQRALIDASVPDAAELKRAIEQAEAELRTNSQQIIQAARDVAANHRRLGDLRDVKDRLNRLAEPRLQAIVAKQTTVGEARAYGQLARARVQDMAEANETVTRDAELLQAKEKELDARLESDENAYSEARKALGGVREALATVVEEAGSVAAAINSLQNAIGQLDAAMEKVEQAIDTEIAQQGDDLAPVIEQRQQLRERYTALQPYETARADALSRYEGLLTSRTDVLVPARHQAAMALFAARNTALKQVRDSLSALPGPELGITLSLGGQADRGTFAQALGHQQGQGLLKGDDIPRHKYDRRWAHHISGQMTNAEFLLALLRRDAAALAKVTKPDGTRLLDDNDIAKLLDARSPVSAEDAHDINEQRLTTLLTLSDENQPDDLPVIALDGRPVEELSPGQRCSALLPIILLSGEHPVVIDQPEDNIDNLHVFDCLVEVLRELKHRRQIICATHNANIVVSGDAEQVVVCEGRDKDSGRIARQASIDDDDTSDPAGGVTPGVVSHVKRVMEGGEQAFRTRARKYGYRLES